MRKQYRIDLTAALNLKGMDIVNEIHSLQIEEMAAYKIIPLMDDLKRIVRWASLLSKEPEKQLKRFDIPLEEDDTSFSIFCLEVRDAASEENKRLRKRINELKKISSSGYRTKGTGNSSLGNCGSGRNLL